MRLIDAEALKESVASWERSVCKDCIDIDCVDCIMENVIDSEPTVDVEIPIALYENGRFIQLHKFDTDKEKDNEAN